MLEWVGFAKLAEQLAELLKKLRSEKDRRDNEASAYFQQLSAAIGEVAANLRNDEVPRISGNEMNTLIHAFSSKTKGVFSEKDASETRGRLSDAARTAETLDAYILENTPIDPFEREQRLAALERIAGHCRALGGILSKP